MRIHQSLGYIPIYLMTLLLGFFLLASPSAQAALVCETTFDECTSTFHVPGKGEMCQRWEKKQKCVETNADYSCASNIGFSVIKNSCYVTGISGLSSITVNNKSYVTSANYAYRCAFGEWSDPTPPLPEEYECVSLGEELKGFPEATLPLGTHPTVDGKARAFTIKEDMREENTEKHVCYHPSETECTSTCYENQEELDANGNVIGSTQVAVPCGVSMSPDQCSFSHSDCAANTDWTKWTEEQGLPFGDLAKENASILAEGPDGRCTEFLEWYTCQADEAPMSSVPSNCTFERSEKVNIQSNGQALAERQHFVCTETSTKCVEVDESNPCLSPNAWGWDGVAQQTSSSPTGLGEYNQAVSQLDAVEKGINEEDLYIFSGQNLKCKYAVGNFLNTLITIALVVGVSMLVPGGGLAASALSSAANAAATAGVITASQAAFIAANAAAITGAASIGSALISDIPNSQALGSNCCKDEIAITGSDKWYKFGKCTADEVKLAVARQKGLTKYMGEYCSKKSGFPLRQCVQKTKSYCVFDDKLALVINNEGRKQLEAIAAADVKSASVSNDIGFPLYAAPTPTSGPYSGVMDNGSWIKLTEKAGSPVYFWQYPGYCRSIESQQAAHKAHLDETEEASNIKGWQPSEYEQVTPDPDSIILNTPEFDEDAAMQMIGKIASLKPFQECATTEGLVHFMTCDGLACDEGNLPESPEGNTFDIFGEDIDPADVNWRTQQVAGNYIPGDYGANALMNSNKSFAAVSSSINPFVTATGSCQAGDCLYRFAFTDKKANEGLGARKRKSDYANFPLYALKDTAAMPSITYLSPEGELDVGAYSADPNKGLGHELDINRQRFIFRPNHQSVEEKGKLHSHVLLEWSPYVKKKVWNCTRWLGSGENLTSLCLEGRWEEEYYREDYRPILVPTDLPPATMGFSPHGDTTMGYSHFYLSGGCNKNSRWCSYEIQVDLNITRHPWGSAKNPRCWGFSVEQIAALDFDQMDLSEWLNSLDLEGLSAGLDEEMAEAFTEQVLASAQTAYSDVKDGREDVQQVATGTKALVVNTDTLPYLSGPPYEAYVVRIAVPTQWPHFPEDGVLTNGVFLPTVDWGDGTPPQFMVLDNEEGYSYIGEHDYGDSTEPEHLITVTFDTASSGPQKLTSRIRVTPNAGNKKSEPIPDFSSPGSVGKGVDLSTPSLNIDGTKTDQLGAEQNSVGGRDRYLRQGEVITRPN